LKAGDVFALVSRLEGFSVSLAEAMATGLPCVVSDIPANRQLVESGVHGDVVPLADSQKLADQIVAFLTDPVTRQRMGANGRQRIAESYSPDVICARYEEVFAGVTPEQI
jgi:glycosyltransferase involved in cell wall biosynthesis